MSSRSILYIAVISVLLGIMLPSCSSSKQARTGDAAFGEKSYSLAATLYQTELSKESDPAKKAKKVYNIAESYRMNGQLDKAERWYEEAVRSGTEPIATFYYAQSLKTNGKYKQAIDQFGNYAKLDPFNKQKAFDEIKATQLAAKWEKEKSNIEVINLKEVNTNASEFAPVFDKDHNLIFTSDRVDATGNDTYGWTGEKFMDLFTSKRAEDGSYHGVAAFGAVNSGYNEGSPTFSKDFTEMFFTRCGAQGKTDDYCKIFRSEVQTGGWGVPQEIRFFDNDTINVGQPFFYKDKAMIFSSNAPGGYGGKDLWISYRANDASWGEPKNLGNAINTAGDEMFPFVDDNGTLYFASNGLPGLGGTDIFSAVQKGDIWIDPQNMKMPINSSSDDFGMLIEKSKPKDANDAVRMSGFFSSNRPGGSGRDDIYRFSIQNENLYMMDGIVLEKIFENPKDPNSRVVDFKPIEDATVTLDKFDMGYKTIGNTTSDKNGRFKFDLEKETNYVVAGKKDGFLKRTIDATTKGKKDTKNAVVTVKVRLLLERFVENVDINIPNIYYDFDKADLRKESEVVLDTVFDLFKANPELKIQISSHTDSRGDDEYNLKLSQQRAESVVRYLVNKGIPLSRLTAVGYGETQLVNKCANGVECTEEEHEKNRRTTFRILSERFKIDSFVPDSINTVPKAPEKK